MATGQERNHGSYHIMFMYQGKRRWFTLGKVSREEADAKSAQVEYLLRLNQRLVELPPGVGMVEYLQHDGKPPARATAIPERRPLTLDPNRRRDTPGGLPVSGCAFRWLQDERSLEAWTLHPC